MKPATFGDAPPAAQGLYDPANEHDACGIGVVAHLRGERSRRIVRDALELLVNLEHRSATAGDAETGDGAGILLQIPHAFLRGACRALDIALPELGAYGVAMVFLPREAAARAGAIARIERIIAGHACRVLGWRDVDVDDEALSPATRASRPAIHQCFVAPPPLDALSDDPATFERTLYLIRRLIERDALTEATNGTPPWYIASLSSRTVVYKGRLRPDQLARFYRDLTDPRVESGLALVHSRFSTNTFPSWPLAHPYRMLCHNGEINTLRGNVAWMRAREALFASPRFATGVDALLPIVQPAQSDSASLDNVLELLVHGGRPLAHAMAMLVPEAWERDDTMPADRRAFYEFCSAITEPWDGPAAIAFTDGRHVGAVQDRNGLRPARFVVTDDDVVIIASEAGALAVSADRIRDTGRLQPGRMLLVNTTQGRLLRDDEIKSELAAVRPYHRWLAEHQVELPEPSDASDHRLDERALRRAHRLFGYTREEIATVLRPMVERGEEPVGSMGNDTPIAVLSERPQLLFSYFRQLFAQVTNPPIDPIREELVTSLGMRLGPQANLLEDLPQHARQIRIEHPVLSAAAFAALRAIDAASLTAQTLPTLFDAATPDALAPALDALCANAVAAARSGASVLILSDRGASAERAPIPSLLAVSAVHHHLIRAGVRARVSLVVEAGDAREVSHVALLFAYGASAMHPYLALETCATLGVEKQYIKAIEKGLLKILSKMGIATLRSYSGSQQWEVLGLDRALVDTHFTGTASRLGGVDLSVLAHEVLDRHAAAFGAADDALLDPGGEYHYRAQGEHHAWNPRAIATLQRATRENAPHTFREFSRLADDANRNTTLRGLLDIVAGGAVPLDEVEPASSIVRRFATGAMSFGSISTEAHETLAIAMNRIGGRSNTGEGGEAPERFGTERNSAIKQVASARFGVTTEYLVNAAELQIKIAQGAKPGEGGQLPGAKVDEMIARTRHSTPGVTLISPPPHHDIYSIEDLKQLVYDLRSVNPAATISVKLVAESGVGTVAAGVVKAEADLVVVAGDSGGTGASPLSSIKRAGVPWELGLAETQQTLLLNDLRGRVRLQVDGQLKTGRDVVIAALLGADEFGFATAPLIVEGCVMMRKCHLNTCPVGIATQDPELRAKFTGRPEHVVNYFFFVAEEARALMATLGFRTFDEMVGRTDLLRQRNDILPAKARTLDLAPLLHAATLGAAKGTNRSRPRSTSFDDAVMTTVAPALEGGDPVRVTLPVRNVHRAIGARISGAIARRHGSAGLPPDTVTLRLSGSAGQSFGAFASRGLTLDLEGEANDYVGKGLSGGRIIIHPPRRSRVMSDATVVVGNTALYGATSGEAFIAGAAGERFAVRNSGATAVVEGAGDHACEYMTGGIVVVLGSLGRNFAAGMSGGVVYVLDDSGVVRARTTSAQLEVTVLSELDEQSGVRSLLERHLRYTGSRRARHLLAVWPETVRRLVRVMPVEYKQALAANAARLAASEAAKYG